jgi:mRNA interferase RelE/StbE
MGAYRIEVSLAARKAILDLPEAYRDKIEAKIGGLAAAARPRGALKLSAKFGMYRLRQGPYRIIYTIDDAARVVKIHAVAARNEAYR